MVTIRVDEKACVGCSLCVDECPTEVFAFDEAKRVPRVEKPEACFGCLSCSKVCPSDAIDHEGIPVSTALFHDPYSLRVAASLGLAGDLELGVDHSQESIAKAMTDMGVRLLSMASVLRQTLGGALPAVGRMAGTTLAAQLPRYQVPGSFEEAVELVRQNLSPAWVLSHWETKDSHVCVTMGDCFVRQLCTREGLSLGGDLCTLFTTYLLGYLGKVAGARMRLVQSTPGPQECLYTFELHR